MEATRRRAKGAGGRPAVGALLALAAIALVMGIIAAAIAATLAARARYVRDNPPCDRACPIDLYPFRTGDLVLTCNRTWRRSPRRRRPQDDRDEGAEDEGDRPAAGPWGRPDWSVPIKAFTRSHFHHTAVVYVEPRTRQVLFWEINSTGTRLSTVADMMSGRPDHDVFVRSLVPPIDPALFERALAAQWEHEFNFFSPVAFVRRAAGLRERSLPRWSAMGRACMRRRRWWRRRKDNDDDDDDAPRRTCSNMTAELYHLIGVLDYEGALARGQSILDPAAVCAGDFARDPIDRDVLPLASGLEFGPLVRLLDPS
jgi:hypothetical protein